MTIKPKKVKKPMARALQTPMSLAIRLAFTPALALGLPSATNLARGLGRAYAAAPFNKKRLQRAIDHLEVAYPSWELEKRREYAIRAYQHLFELGAELSYTTRQINHDGWLRHLSLTEIVPAIRPLLEGKPCILITGHCGNWELIGYSIAMLGFPMHAVYRPLDLKPLDNWVRQSRERRGLTLVNKFGAVRALPPAVAAGIPAGFVADQNGGDRGVFVPFFGRLTSTYKSIGLMAMQFNATIICGCARRLAQGEVPARHPLICGPVLDGAPSMRYAVETTDVFGPEDWSTHPDPLFYLTARYRRAIETMVRRAPEQYLWMHRLWRSRPPHERQGKPFPDSIRRKMELLPWMTGDDVERVVDRSARDGRELAGAVG